MPLAVDGGTLSAQVESRLDSNLVGGGLAVAESVQNQGRGVSCVAGIDWPTRSRLTRPRPLQVTSIDGPRNTSTPPGECAHQHRTFVGSSFWGAQGGCGGARWCGMGGGVMLAHDKTIVDGICTSI